MALGKVGHDPSSTWRLFAGGVRLFFAEIAPCELFEETCSKLCRDPQRAFSGQRVVRVKPELHARSVWAAELAGKSLNQWAEEVLGKAAE